MTRTKVVAKRLVQLIIILIGGCIFPVVTPGNNGNSANRNETTVKDASEENILIDIKPEIAYKPESIRAGLVFDVSQNKVVWEKGMNERNNIASLSKMMTALITLEEIENGNLCWDSLITVTREASLISGSKVYLNAGKKLTVEELLNAAMIYSGNDACYLLAQTIGGTEYNFAQKMNFKAFELGMKNTRYFNSTGLPVGKGLQDNYSTPADLLILAKELLKHEEILQITKKKTETLHNGKNQFVYSNRNKLVSTYADEIDGLKTGFTRSALYCLCATGKRCDYRVVTIVLGVESGWLRNEIVANMFNNYYSTIGLGPLGECTDPHASAEPAPYSPE